jgi:hypothetical protein
MIGFSTGCLYKYYNPLSKEAIEIVKSSGCKYIELCAGKIKRMGLLKLLNRKDFAGFDYKSFHLPCGVRYFNDEITRRLFEKVSVVQKRIGFDTFVLHPDLVDDWDFIHSINLPFSFENMDNRKKFGKSVEDMQMVFLKKDFGFVLDLTHAYTNDSSMKLAQELYENLYSRLCHFHLSGYSVKKRDKGDSSHCPLFITKQEGILTSVPLDKPIIIESTIPVCAGKNKKKKMVEQLREELNYVNSFVR